MSPMRKSISRKIKQMKAYLQLATNNKHTNIFISTGQRQCNDFLNLYLALPSDASAQDVDYFYNSVYQQGNLSVIVDE